MLIDCDTCVARPRACGGCVVSHLLSARAPDGPAHLPVSLDDREWVAVGTLAAAGLVPPLRLVPRAPAPAVADRPAPAEGPPGRSPGGPSGPWRQSRDSA